MAPAAPGNLAPLAPGLAPASSFWIVGRPEEAQLTASGPVRRVGAMEAAEARADELRRRRNLPLVGRSDRDGGAIDAADNVPRGTRFVIELPC